MQQLIMGLTVSLLTQAVKKWPQITFVTADTKKRVQILAGLLSVIVTVATAYAQGQLGEATTMDVIGASLSTWVMSVVSYYMVIKG